MKILKVEKSNCGWFVRYEHFDWCFLLVALFMESVWVYGISIPFMTEFTDVSLWPRILLWTVFFGSLVLAVFQPLALIIGTYRADWFVTKEKFVTKIKIMVDN